jgi:phage tail-like protein
MASPDREEPLLRVSSFEVLIDGRELGFAQVGPLASETDSGEPADRRPHPFAPVVLRRALTTSTELYDWRRNVVAGKEDRRDVTVRQLSSPGGSVVNTWRLVRAWPRRWTGPAFDALSNELAWEEIELMFDDLLWLGDEPTCGG